MKRVLIIATGGTIASVEGEGGLAPALTGEQLAAHVPQLGELCDFDIVQPMNIDSTNMRPADWLRIASTITGAYEDYDGFVVLHGTDTMAYTSAALSYLVQGSQKPIVLTGSQQPMAAPFTDAKLNLYQSLAYAVDDESRDVSVVFGGSAIVGTRARKQRTMSYNAFASVNLPPAAVIRGSRVVRYGQAAPTGPDRAGAGEAGPRCYDRLDPRVLVLRLTPGLDPSLLEGAREGFDGVVLETFGIGGIPEWEDGAWRRAIFSWVDSGRALVLTTQVAEEGLDLGVYEVGRAFADHPGILRGDDMTTEAIVAKTMWALGQTRDPDRLEELFYRPVNSDRLPL